MKRYRFLNAICTIFLAACAASTPTSEPVDVNALSTQAVATLFTGLTQTAQPTSTATATNTPEPTLTPTRNVNRTPPALAATFTTGVLNPLDTPHTYIQDTCQHLHDKWASTNSAPGTVMMVIMIHAIASGTPPQPFDMTETAFRKLMEKLIDNGFAAINASQVLDFLENNAKIPPRSVLLIADDRRSKLYFDTYFRPLWEGYGWPVVSAWISSPINTSEQWQEHADLEAEGWVDNQSHGVNILAIDEASSDTYILNELSGSMTAFQEHFNKKPIAFIWPGGGFTPHAVELARQTGYRLGFTINPRGPLMFNWIPLADSIDQNRPFLIPEDPANDPLMVLPRYWSTDAIRHINEVIQIGQEAGAYAEQNKAAELEYYDIVCAPTYGPMP